MQCFEVLFCDAGGECGPKRNDGEMARSPVECLHKAVDGNPRLIVVHFATRDIREREALVELCAVLKRNTHTRRIPVLALLRARHRRVMEDLDRAGVEYVRFAGETFKGESVGTGGTGVIEAPGPGDLLKRQLAIVCPHLHYSPIDARRELVVCGAYLDRLVLESGWRHHVCESEDHLRCDHFLKPRSRS